MPLWLSELMERSNAFIPHGHCYLWIPSLLWLHVISDALIGTAYLGISLILYLLVRKIRLPFSPVFIAFGLFIGLCGLTHFLAIWTVWNPDYWLDGMVKAATAAASVATAVGLFFIRPQVEEMVHAARLSEERRIRLESTNAQLRSLYEKVREQDELKTQFFANVSHELRTPLALILGPAERILEDDKLTDFQRRQVESISRNGKSLLKQVNDLLDIAQLEEGKKQVRYEKLDLVPWFARICSQFEVAAENRQIDFKVQYPEQLVAEVDADMLERIFINLLSNAFKFTPHGGRIGAELMVKGSDLTFCVEDSGPGVDAGQRETIFERFRQADGSSTRSFGGTGLGLAIVKDFVVLHRGNITVDTGEFGGARFSVRLPLNAPGHLANRQSVSTHSPNQLAPNVSVALDAAVNELGQLDRETDSSTSHLPDRATILVVEDTPDMTRFIADTFKTTYNVATAADGREGLEMALALRPDVVVTDIMMPHMSGDQLVRELRQHGELDHVPVLLLTAKADDDLRVNLLQNGAQDYVPKPVLPQELLARVANLVQFKRTGDALRHELSSASLDLEGLAAELALKHRQLQSTLELAQVAREQAEKASEVKTHFLSMISHEMRTPLATIHLNAQLLGRHPEAENSAAFKTQLERTIRATGQLATMIEGLLEYTRFESGRTGVRHEVLDVKAIVKDAIEVGHLQIPSDRVTLSMVDVPADLPPLVSDSRLLRVILNNLISNALKFTREGRVDLSVASMQNFHVFEVRDTGIGIPTEDLPRIFLPFEQLEPLQRKSIPGVGLGLSLTKEIVDALGGRLEVESEPEKGSTFRVVLPSTPIAGKILDPMQEKTENGL